MSNASLLRANKAKNNEFYTQYEDIEKEMFLHREYFADKIVYCPCDDYERSQFVRFFLDHFNDFELKGLIATCYAYSFYPEPDLFNEAEMRHGKVLCCTRDETTYGFLEGTGDFRSKECTAFRDRADIITTNPPFSLFREFFSWAKDKDLELVAPLTCVFYNVCFPFFKSRKVMSGGRVFDFDTPNGKAGVTCNWLSTFPYTIPPLNLTACYSPKKYPKYDDYDAIEVSKIKDIPKDYFGVMGVPISFFEKWNPEQFEVLSSTRGDGRGSFFIDGQENYVRVLIRRRHDN